MVEMNVGIDLDLTLRDINTALVDVYLRYYPQDKSNIIPMNRWTVYSYTPYFPIGKEIQNFLADHPDEISTSSPVFDGAQDFMRELCRISKVTIVTYQRNKRFEELVLEWLDTHKIEFHNVLFLKDKTKFKGNFLLDDCVHNLNAIKLAGNCTPVCRDCSWNQEWDGLRIKHYDEFLNIVRTNLESIEAN